MRLFPYTPLPYTANIIGIDPGSETLGLSVITFNVTNMEIMSTQAHTFVGSKLPFMNEWDCATHSARFSRINAHAQNLLNVFNHYQPLQVACESPFFNPRRPNAFEVLVEVLNAIRRTVYTYDPWRHLYMIDPPTVKNSVHAKGGADKDVMKMSVSNLRQELKIINDSQYEMFDEHSIDAIAVAYCRYKGLCNSVFHQG